MTIIFRMSLWEWVVQNELPCRSLQVRTYSSLDMYEIVPCQYIEIKENKAKK